MRTNNLRKSSRVEVDMNLRSASLPRYQAHIVDLSESGARIELSGAVSKALENQRIRFGASLAGQQNSQFEGLARVAWIKETSSGWEAGLEWEKLTPSEWTKVSLVVEQHAA